MQELTERISLTNSLSPEEIQAAVKGLLDPDLDPDSKAAFLSALHERGESPQEIAGLVEALLEHAVPLPVEGDSSPLLDVCGTGGDKAGLFNVSTTVLFLVAACGVRVVKHGNRGLTSKSGGADVLESLGVPIDLPPDQASAFLERHGFVFLFAPYYHPAFRIIAPVRQLLAARGRTTVFNLLGPLLNPARPTHQLAGVFQERVLPTYAEVFRLLGRHTAWAVHGRTGTDSMAGGLDEISTMGPTSVVEMLEGRIRPFTLQPSDFAAEPTGLAELQGATPEKNASLLLSLLRGTERGPKLDLVLANASAALVVAGVAGDLATGRARALEAIETGRALKILESARSRT